MTGLSKREAASLKAMIDRRAMRIADLKARLAAEEGALARLSEVAATTPAEE